MIRRMKESDLSAAAGLEARYFSVPWSEKSLKESLESSSYLFLVMQVQGEVVGYAGLFRTLDEGNITNIVLEESCRGRGLGRELTEALLEEGRKCGMRAFTLEVRVSNKAAIQMYESMGFVQEGVRRRFYEKPEEDALIMWKREPEE